MHWMLVKMQKYAEALYFLIQIHRNVNFHRYSQSDDYISNYVPTFIFVKSPNQQKYNAWINALIMNIIDFSICDLTFDSVIW